MSALQLEEAADVLGPLIEELVFVGGATVHLWITDRGAPPIRATEDVDVVCDVATLSEYYRLGDRLRERGLREGLGEKVICRWRSADPKLVVDVMPTDSKILGFSNRWYEEAIETADRVRLGSGVEIRVARPPVLIATKICAWKGRGRGDLLLSLDIHDVLTLIDGRPELVDEIRTARSELRDYIRGELIELRQEPYFTYAVESAMATYGSVGEERATLVNGRIDAILS